MAGPKRWNEHYESTDWLLGPVLSGPQMSSMVYQHAKQSVQLIRARAPKRSGRLAASIEARLAIESFKTRSYNVPRAIGRVYATAPYAAAVEFGNERFGSGTHFMEGGARRMKQRKSRSKSTLMRDKAYARAAARRNTAHSGSVSRLRVRSPGETRHTAPRRRL